jgi:hypothetical protein
MSTVLPIVEDPTLSEPRSFGRPGRVVWTWAVVACVLLATSGVVRALQERRHQFDQDYKEVCPIDLAKIPLKLGDDWHLVKGGERQLDQMTMRITGGSDHFVRIYANNLTGVSMVVLLLYGPAEPVLPHTPEICYPASGFSGGEYPSERTIKYTAGKDAEGRPIAAQGQFQSASYQKSAGRSTLREAVYHSFRLDGLWSPSIGMGRKFPRRNPGIFKIQIQRQVAEGETIGEGDPIEQFLGLFLSEIEGEIKNATSTPKGLAAR